MLTSLTSSLRLSVRSSRPLPALQSRTLRSSAPLFRKSKPTFDDETEDLDVDDLFDASDAPSSSGSRADQRSSLVRSILSVAALPGLQRRAAASQARVGELRKVVQLTDEEDVEGLKEVIKAWRLSGRRVTTKTAEEIVGRCVNLGRTDLAREIVENQLQYGLPPLPEAVQRKLA